MDELQVIALFYLIDNFCQEFEPAWQRMLLEHSTRRHWWEARKPRLSLSERLTIVLLFHISGYRTFKAFYLFSSTLRSYFPKLLSYSQFINRMPQLAFPMFMLQKSLQGVCTGISLIDSTALSVCHICRSHSHHTFKGIAKKGKTTVGWFFGMKLHLIINHIGEIIAWALTSGNVHDISTAERLSKGMFGKLIGDRGYVSQKLFQSMYERGLQLTTRLRRNMKNTLVDVIDKALLRSRGVIESVIARLKLSCQIDHHRHRSPRNFFVNLCAGLAAYGASTKKPTIHDVFLA